MLEEDITYTLVSQGTEGRLSTLRHTCERWKGNISLAVYTNKTEEAIIEYLVHDMECDKEQLTVTCVPPFEELRGKGFPYNYLRRVALDAAVTSHIVYLDMDFVPSSDLEQSLNSPAVLKEFTQDNKLALVVAAFEVLKAGSNISVPKTRNQLNGEDLIKGFPFNFFHRDTDSLRRLWVDAHAPTDFAKWSKYQTDTVYPVDCVSTSFEPYIVVQKCQHLPPPQDQFLTGHDKMSWIRHLVLLAYNFKVIAGPFCIHLHHNRIAGEDFYDYLNRGEMDSWRVKAMAKEFYNFVAATARSKNVTARMHNNCGRKQHNAFFNEYVEVITKINKNTKIQLTDGKNKQKKRKEKTNKTEVKTIPESQITSKSSNKKGQEERGIFWVQQ